MARILWCEQEDPTDTGKDIDTDYLDAQDYVRKTSVSQTYPSFSAEIASESGDSSGSQADGFIDENAQSHTSANESSSIVGSTFYADPSRNSNTAGTWSEWKWNRLFLYHAGKDSYNGASESKNPRLKENKSAKFNHQRAEIICDYANLTSKQKHAVLEAVDSTQFNRYTYLGAMETVVVGIIVCVMKYWSDNPLDTPQVRDAIELVGVDDPEYVAEQVADKKQFSWLQ